MSKTPLKYNAGLVQGAYEAASAGQPGPGQQDACLLYTSPSPRD